MKTKKIVYIAAFTALGILLGFVFHGLIEIYYIKLLLSDFSGYSFGLSWGGLFAVHKVFSAATLLGGVAFGFFSGRFWWKYIYIDKKCRRFHLHGENCVR